MAHLYLGKLIANMAAGRVRREQRAVRVAATPEESKMLYWAGVFLIIAIVAAIVGWGSLAGLAATIAKILFVVFLVLFVLSLFTGRGRSVMTP